MLWRTGWGRWRVGSPNEVLVGTQETHEAILETLVSLLPFDPSGVPPPATRTYAWGPLTASPSTWHTVSTREDGRMIVAGTTGLRTWQASVALANHVVADAGVLGLARGGAVLELGAGAGLLAMVCGRVVGGQGGGGGRVWATDVDEGVLLNLRENVERSECGAMGGAEGGRHSLDRGLGTQCDVGANVFLFFGAASQMA